jgi:predicted nucleotidyltransferase component of viral defense system
MTPLQKRLLVLTRSLRVPLTTLEKDIALGALLAAIAADPVLARTLVFKGGTALKRLYFGDAYRFSEDLDFSAVAAPRGADLASLLDQARVHAVTALSAEGPFDATLEPLRVRDAHPGGPGRVRRPIPLPLASRCPLSDQGRDHAR